MGSKHVPHRLNTAIEAVETEIQRTRTESEAFAAFRKRVATINAEEPRADGGTRLLTPVRMVQQKMKPTHGEQVRQAYRETILAMPHYTDEYDEPLRDHMAAELGQEVVTAIFTGSGLTAQVKQLLLESSQRTHDQREELLDKLPAEQEALTTARATVTEIVSALREFNATPLEEYSFDDLRMIYRKLDQYQATCEETTVARQQTLQADHWTGIGEQRTTDLQSYLYHDFNVTYPILAEIAEVCQLLQEAQLNVRRALTTTP